MCMIKKRDGREVRFNRQKIINAVLKAINNSGEEIDEIEKQNIANKVADYVDASSTELSVEDIQDQVIYKLKDLGFESISKAYSNYRKQRTIEREKNSSFMIEMEEKLTASNVQNQNANVDEYSFGGRKGEADSTFMKYIALNHIMSKKSKNNHENNRIYIHDLDSYVVGMHNCFQRNTEFITNYGVKTFEYFKDGDKVQVIDKDGSWRDATVRFYGRKPMQQVTFERCGKTKVVNCTPDHRWILNNGEVTTSLSVGDRLYSSLSDREFKIESQRDAEMFCLGLVLADGTDAYSNNKNDSYIKIRLCGEKTKYSSIFESVYYKEHNSVENTTDKFYCRKSVVGKQSFLTNRMWDMLTPRDKEALFNGYYAGDGNKTTENASIDTTDERIVEMLKDISIFAGYYIFSIKEIVGDTNYKKNRTLFHVSFTKSISNNTLWKVVDIKRQPNKDYEAWCIEEPITHSFTLSDGVVTGNCLSFPFDDILAKGFNTRQTDVRPANSVNTAFQLVAVLFQLQSLQQFGGVSATHLDWTMVPYIRKSLMKHYISAYIESTDEFADLDIMDMVFDTYEEVIKDGNDEFIIERNKFDDWIDSYKDNCLSKFNLSEEDFFIGSDKLNKKLYNQALYRTINETQQAVEGMYHNLNTLQSRSGKKQMIALS